MANKTQKLKECMTRRDFLGRSAMFACLASWVLAGIGLLKFPKPALLPDISRVFKIGKPDEFPIGTKKIFEKRKVMIIRDKEGIFAISLICPHLGCIVADKGDEGFSCPCHGSKFDRKGYVQSGPAPKPLQWLSMSLHPSGKLLINAGKGVPVGTKLKV